MRRSLAVLVLASVALGCGPSGRVDNARIEASAALEQKGLVVSQAAFRRNVRHGDLEVLALYLAAGQSATGGLPDAAQAGRCDVLGWLIDNGANVESLAGSQALAWSIEGGLEPCRSLLLEGGADLDVRDRSWATPLYRSSEAGRCRAVRRLLSAGADAEAATTVGLTPLMAAVAAGHADCVVALAESGVNVDSVDRDGWTALMFAAASGTTEMVDLLLSYGADDALESALGWTARELAAFESHDDVLSRLGGSE